MMGSKERHFAPLINVSVEQLVPQDHFYRHLERTLDLTFVREFVEKTYGDAIGITVSRTQKSVVSWGDNGGAWSRTWRPSFQARRTE